MEPVQGIENLEKRLEPIFDRYHSEIVAAYLFGSVATGQISLSSDIDIAVLLRKNSAVRGGSFKFAIYADLCRELKRNDIDIVLLDLAGNLILNDEIIRRGEVLYVTDEDAKDEFELKLLHRCTDFKFQRRFATGV